MPTKWTRYAPSVKKNENLVTSICTKLIKEGAYALSLQQQHLRSMLGQLVQDCGLGPYELEELTAFADAYSELLRRVLHRPGGTPLQGFVLNNSSELNAALEAVCHSLQETVMVLGGDKKLLETLSSALRGVLEGMRDMAYSVRE
eukprot:PhF_6_TR43521/c1_g1_i1/m.66809